jgi:hypothetical protein
MGSLLRDQSSAQVDEQVIWYALDQFAKDHLLEERVKRPPEMGRVSRRELIQRIGLAASIPLVVSVLAPTVFASASCVQTCSLPNLCTVPGCQSCPTLNALCQPG